MRMICNRGVVVGSVRDREGNKEPTLWMKKIWRDWKQEVVRQVERERDKKKRKSERERECGRERDYKLRVTEM